MQTQIKVASAAQAWQLAQDCLQTTYADSEFVAYLKDAALIYFEAGRFIFETPTDQIAGLLSRRAENLAIQRALEIYIPKDIEVCVEFTTAGTVAS